MGVHPPRPLLQFTPFKLINLAYKHYNLGILVLTKIKYPVASGRLRPCFRDIDTMLGLAPSFYIHS